MQKKVDSLKIKQNKQQKNPQNLYYYYGLGAAQCTAATFVLCQSVCWDAEVLKERRKEV